MTFFMLNLEEAFMHSFYCNKFQKMSINLLKLVIILVYKFARVTDGCN